MSKYILRYLVLKEKTFYKKETLFRFMRKVPYKNISVIEKADGIYRHVQLIEKAEGK